jgi:hypothetical protein
MENKQTSMIIKIILLVGVILCGLSQILPWMGYSITFMGQTAGTEFYPWGFHSYMPGSDQWVFFYLDSGSMSNIGNLESIQIQIIIFMLITFILSIIALIAGIIGIKNAGVKKSKASLAAGIIAIIAAVLFLIGINYVFSQLDPTGTWAQFYTYSFGFYLMIIAGIIFIVGFGIQMTIKAYPTPTQPAYQQDYYQQPQQPPAQTPPPAQPPQAAAPTPPAPPVQPAPPPPQPPTHCPNCGVPLVPGAKFCSKCGHKFQ